MKQNKILAVLFLVSFAFLSACSGSDGTNAPTDSDPDESNNGTIDGDLDVEDLDGEDDVNDAEDRSEDPETDSDQIEEDDALTDSDDSDTDIREEDSDNGIETDTTEITEETEQDSIEEIDDIESDEIDHEDTIENDFEETDSEMIETEPETMEEVETEIEEDSESESTENDSDEQDESDIPLPECLFDQTITLPPIADGRAGRCTPASPVDWRSFPSDWTTDYLHVYAGENGKFCIYADTVLFCTVGDDNSMVQAFFHFEDSGRVIGRSNITFKPGTEQLWFSAEEDWNDTVVKYWDAADGTIVQVDILPNVYTITGIGFDLAVNENYPVLFDSTWATIFQDGNWLNVPYGEYGAIRSGTFPQMNGRMVFTFLTGFLPGSGERTHQYYRWSQAEDQYVSILPVYVNEDFPSAILSNSPTLLDDRFELLWVYLNEERMEIEGYDLDGNLLDTEPFAISEPDLKTAKYIRYDETRYLYTRTNENVHKLWQEESDGAWASIEMPSQEESSVLYPSRDEAFYAVSYDPVRVYRLHDFTSWDTVFPPEDSTSNSRIATYIAPNGAVWAMGAGRPLTRTADGCLWEDVSCRPFGNDTSENAKAAIAGWSDNDILVTATGENTVWNLHDGVWEEFIVFEEDTTITEIAIGSEDFAALAVESAYPEFFTWNAGEVEYHAFPDATRGGIELLKTNSHTNLFALLEGGIPVIFKQGEMIELASLMGEEPAPCTDLDLIDENAYFYCDGMVYIMNEEPSLVEERLIHDHEYPYDDLVYVDMVYDESGNPKTLLDESGCFWDYETGELDNKNGYCFPATDRLMRVSDGEYIATGKGGAFIRILVE